MCMTHRIGLAAWLLSHLLLTVAEAAPPEPQGVAGYFDGYHQAMIQLREGKWKEAVASLTEAEKLARGDGRILMARGVARTLMGEMSDAYSDLDRTRLQETREPQLWKSVIDCMTNGQLVRQQTGGRGQHWFSGVPGHLVQGGKDYRTNYASFVVYDMAWPHYLKLAESKPFDEKAMAATKVQAGRWFANRMLATKEFSSRNFAQAKKLMAQDSLVEAREMLDFALAPYSFDADMRALSGDLWLRVGRPATARAEYTQALTISPNLASAYLSRAEAAAMMGDQVRADQDLKLAQQYGIDTKTHVLRIVPILSRSVAKGDPTVLLAELDKAAEGGAAVEQLVPLAERLHRAMSWRRQRYDESYQEVIRRNEDLIRADDKNVDARLDVAQFLLYELDNRGENVEPRRGRVNYRVQFSRGMEVHRANFYVDKALAIAPKNPRGLVLKAMVLTEMGQEATAARVINEAVTLAGTGDAQAVKLLAEFRRRQVARMFSQASALRTPTFSSSSYDDHRSDGVWRVTTTTRYDPSQADLARAASLEAAARQLMQQTKGLMEAAVKLSQGTLPGLLLQSAYEDWFGTRVKALALLREAVRTFPTEVTAHDALVDYLRLNGMRDDALEAEATGLQLVHASCGPLLTRTWTNVDKQGFGPLIDVLHRARKLDPTDVRATAYLAEAERDLQDKAKSAALFKVAAALETARLAIDEQGAAKSWPRRADDMAALMASHLMLARAAKAFNQNDAEIGHYEAVMALAKRFPPDGRETPMFGAVFVSANANRVPVPATPNGARLASTAFLEGGNWYKARNRTDDATRCFTASAVLGVPARNDPFPGRNIPRPNIGTTDPNDSNFNDRGGAASGEAMIELAKIELEKKNYKKAFDMLQAATQAPDLAREKRKEINDLILKILPKLNGQE